MQVSGAHASHQMKREAELHRFDRDCAVDDSCVLCARCFHASNHEGHNISFYLAIQPGGCCDCGDKEAWKSDIQCRFHPWEATVLPSRHKLPSDLRELLESTLDCVVDYALDTFDYSPEEPVPPGDESSIRGAPNDLHRNGPYAVVLWNDEKHSFDEVTSQLFDITDYTREQAFALTDKVDGEVRMMYI